MRIKRWLTRCGARERHITATDQYRLGFASAYRARGDAVVGTEIRQRERAGDRFHHARRRARLIWRPLQHGRAAITVKHQIAHIAQRGIV